MIISKFEGIAVDGVACCVPANEDPIARYKKKFGTDNVDRFVAMTGAATKYVALPKQTAADLAFVAAKRLLEARHVEAEEIGALIFVSETPDYRTPATAFVLQAELGLGKDCICFDINLGCSGFVNGVNVLCSLMKSSNIEKGLLLVGDTMSKTVSPDDHSVCMLLGDAASATLLTKKNDAPVIQTSFMCDGSKFDSVIIPAGGFRNMSTSAERVEKEDGNRRSEYDFYMDGANIFIFSTSDVPRFVNAYLSEVGKSESDYDGLVLHQANDYIIKRFAKRVRFPMEKVPVSISRYGNTIGSSIPVTIVDAYGGKMGKELSLLTCGFGVGLSWGVVEMKLDGGKVLPMIFSSETMKD